MLLFTASLQVMMTQFSDPIAQLTTTRTETTLSRDPIGAQMSFKFESHNSRVRVSDFLVVCPSLLSRGDSMMFCDIR